MTRSHPFMLGAPGALGAFVALATGCARPAAPAPPTRLLRPELEELRPGPPAAFEPGPPIPLPADGWEVSGGSVELAGAGGGESTELRLVPAAESSEITLVLAAEVDPARVDRIALVLQTPAMMYATAGLLRAGEEVRKAYRTPAVAGGDELRRVWLDLSNVPDDLPPFDGLQLSFRRVRQPFTLLAVETARVPPLARLPQVARGARLVEIGGEARRAVGLSDRRPLVARFRAPPRSRLSFSYGWPGELSAEGRRAELVVRVRVDAAPALEARYPLVGRSARPNPVRPSGSGPRWSWAELGLGPFAGRELAVEFALDAEGEAEAVCALGPPEVTSAGAPPPTVLLITSDTHRYDHVGRAALAPVSTPALDALADRGRFFEDCQAAANVTLPAHLALLCGTSPRDTRVFQNSVPISDRPETLAERFRAAGYATAAVVSTRHLGDPESGLGQGFDRMSWPARTPRTAAQSIQVLERWLSDFEDRPLFVWLHLFDAHTPYLPPSRFAARQYPPDRDPTSPALHTVDFPQPPRFRGLEDVEYPRAMYRAEIDFLDAELARLLARPRVREGVVAFTADHGESLGAHGVWWDHAGLYPDSLHVPLILAWPGAAAGRVKGPVAQTDVGKTLLELAGVDARGFPGRSLLEPGRPEAPRFAIASRRESASVTSASWHLVLALRDHAFARHESGPPRLHRAHEVELYDLAKDPGCQHDLARSEHDTARRLRAALIEWLSQAPAEGWAAGGAPAAESVRELNALGYVWEPALGEGELIDPDCSCPRCRAFARE